MSARLPLLAINSSIAEELVSNHQATLVRVRLHNTSLEAKYIPEPVIGEIATRMMHDDKLFQSALNEISRRLFDGSLGFAHSKGGRGELSAMLYFMRLYDKCVSESANTSGRFFCSAKHNISLYSRPIPVASYLSAVCGASKLPESICNDMALSFTAWHEFVSNPTKLSVSQAFRKRIAIICRENQEAVGLIIPIVPARRSSFPRIGPRAANAKVSKFSHKSNNEVVSLATADSDSKSKANEKAFEMHHHESKFRPSKKAKLTDNTERGASLASMRSTENKKVGGDEVQERDHEENKDTIGHDVKEEVGESIESDSTAVEYDDLRTSIQGISVIAIQVKNWSTNMSLNASKIHCNKQADYMASRDMMGSPVVSILIMVGSGRIQMENNQNVHSYIHQGSLCILLNGFESTLIPLVQRRQFNLLSWIPTPSFEAMVNEFGELERWMKDNSSDSSDAIWRKLMLETASTYQGDVSTPDQMLSDKEQHLRFNWSEEN